MVLVKEKKGENLTWFDLSPAEMTMSCPQHESYKVLQKT